MSQTQQQPAPEFKELGRQILRDQDQLDPNQYRERMRKFFDAYDATKPKEVHHVV